MKCGDCNKWMKRPDCPLEKGTMVGGPSAGDAACKSFAPKPEAPTDFTRMPADVAERMSQYEPKPAKDAGAREWPTEMLKNLDASLKLQSMLAAPDHAWIGPSVIEVATAAYEKLERDCAQVIAITKSAQGRAEIQCIRADRLERELAEAKADWKATKSQLDSTARQFLAERTRAAALVEATESLAKTSRTVAEEIFTDVNCEGKLANQFMGDIIDVEEALAKWGKG